MDLSRYRPNVRVGNWREELYLEEEKLDIFLRKKNKGELMIQKVKKLLFNLLKEVSLAPPQDYVKFGTVVQLLAPDAKKRRKCDVEEEDKEQGLTLSCLVGVKEIDAIQHLDDGCGASLSNLSAPSVRNSFVVLSTDGKERDGTPLCYGEDFLLSPVETMTGNPLYLKSEIPNLTTKLGQSKNPALTLTSICDRNCRWRTLNLNASMRLETEGSPVRPNCKVVINHSASNKNLAVEPRHWFQTYFGLECEVSVCTYLDVHRRETPENIWMFHTQKPTDLTEKFRRAE